MKARVAGGAVVHRQFRLVHDLELHQLPAGRSVTDALRSYRSNPDVLYAEPDYLVFAADTIPNDSLFSLAWGLRNTGAGGGLAGADIGAVRAWDLTTGSADVVVGVIDSGVDASHPDLTGNLLPGISVIGGDVSDGTGHGTHVAGTIGATGNNGIGVAGVNWTVRMLPCKFITSQGEGWTSDAIRCLEYIADLKDQGMNVVATNNSWGGPAYSQALYDAIKEQMDRGILFVAAAGNGGDDDIGDNNDRGANYPAGFDLPNVIAVAATDRSDRLAVFSNFGRHSVHLGAPGVGIVSTIPGNRYESFSGTSMAAPHVTGAAALVKAFNPSLAWWQLRNLLLAGGDQLPTLTDTITGSRLDVYGAMTCQNRELSARLAPAASELAVTINTPVKLTVLHINCSQPGGSVVVTAPGGLEIPLYDDGSNGDPAAGDGIYTNSWTPTQLGTYLLSFPGGDLLTVRVLKPYAFQATSGTYVAFSGTNLNLQDETIAELALPFPVRFGGQTFQKIYVGANGLLSFESAFPNYMPFPLPYRDAGTLVAPFWDDLQPVYATDNNVFWGVNGTAPNRQLVVEWRDVGHWAYPADGTVKFQVVFREDSDDVRFNYADVTFGGANTSYFDGGAYASVGLQVGPREGTQFSFGQRSLTDGLSLLWQLADPEFSLAIHPQEQTAFASQAAQFIATLTGKYVFTDLVSVSCGNGAPSVCTGGATIPAWDGTDIVVSASSAETGVFMFDVQAQSAGADPTLHQQAVTLKVVDFALGVPVPATLTVANGGSASATIGVSASGPFSGAVTLSCSGLPAGASCSFIPSATVSPTSMTPVSVAVTITLASNTALGDYPVAITGTVSGAPATKSQPLVVSVSASPDFVLTSSTPEIYGDNGIAQITVGQQNDYAGTVNLSCAIVPSGPTCAISPGSVGTLPETATLTIAGNGVTTGTYFVMVTGSDGTRSHSLALKYSPARFIMSTPDSVAFNVPASWYSPFNVRFTAENGYKGTLTFVCNAAALNPTATCGAASNVVDFSKTSATTIDVPILIDARGYVYSGSYPLVITATDVTGSQIRQAIVQATPKGFTWEHEANSERTVLVGETSAPITFTFTPYNGFDVATEFAPWSCSPPWTCQLTPPTLVPNGQPAEVAFTASPAIELTPTGDGVASFDIVAGNGQGNTGFTERAANGRVTVRVQDFRLVTPLTGSEGAPTLQVMPGRSGTATINYVALHGFDAPAEVSCSNDIGPGIACSLDRTTVLPGESITATIAVDSSTPPTTMVRYFDVTAVATVNGKQITHKLAFNLLLTTFSVSITPDSITVPSGGAATFTVETEGGYGSGTMDCTTSVPGLTCEHHLTMIIPGRTTITLRTTDGVTPVGSHAFTLTLSAYGSSVSADGTVVMQGHDSLILTSPNGGQTWSSGPQVIRWNYQGNPSATVKLELLKKGLFDRLIAENVPLGTAGQGEYSWTIPADLPFSRFYQVRITSTSDPSITDVSDRGIFWGLGVELIAPDASTVVWAGGYINNGYPVLDVKYGASAGSTVRFDLYKGGQFVKTVGSGPYYWDPDCPCWHDTLSIGSDTGVGTDFTLKAVPLSIPDRAVTSTAFTISDTRIIIVSPASDEYWRPGTTHTISWNWIANPVSPGQDVLVKVWDQSTSAVRVITNSTSIGQNGSGSLAWTVPTDLPTSRAYVIDITAYGPYGGTPVRARSASFALGELRVLTVRVNGSGTVNSSDPFISCPSRCQATYWPGTTVTLHATGAGFAGWSDACTGSADCTLTMEGDKTVTATFSAPSNFALVAVNGSATVRAGGTAPYVLRVDPGQDATTAVALTCSGLPLYTACTFDPNNFTLGQSSVTVNLAISTRGTSAAVHRARTLVVLAWSTLVFFGVFLVSPRLRRRYTRLLLLMTVTAGAFYVGCGGGSSPPPPPPQGTPAGTYMVTVAARSGQASRTATVTLVVQ